MGNTREPILVEPPQFLIDSIKNFMECTYKQSYYKKERDGYMFYCKNCGKEQHLSKEKYKQVKYSNMCPNCCTVSEIHTKPFRKNFHKQDLFGWKDDAGNEVGYYCWYEEKSFYIRQVAYWRKNSKGNREFWARNIAKNIGGFLYYNSYSMPEFTKRRKSCSFYGSLEDMFYWIMDGHEQRYGCYYEPKTYKEFLVENVNPNGYKSNQIYLIKNNLFNSDQIKAIKYFDLKSADEVYKYRKYIDKCHFWQPGFRTRARILNIHYLDYLSKNNIPYEDFMDYARDLETLGYKLDKPKNFYDRHKQIGELIEIKNNEKYRKGIEKSFKKLKKKGLESKGYSIKPIANLEEINHVAKSLHNCMARLYTKPYARGETDLYCLWIEDKPFIAIEVLNGKLEQVRADNNEVPERKYKSIVTKWYRGAYAAR